MAVAKVSLSIDEDLLAEARHRVGRRELSAYVNRALRQQLQKDRLEELLIELDEVHGPVPDTLLAEADELWQPPEPEQPSTSRTD